MTSLIINLSFAVFHRQSLSCEVIDKSLGDTNSPNSKYFPLCPPWSISVALLLFEVSTTIFCVLIRSLHPLNIVYFTNFRCARRMIHPVNCCLAPFPVGFNCPIISQSLFFESRVRIRPLRSESLRIICFRNFSRQRSQRFPRLPLF